MQQPCKLQPTTATVNANYNPPQTDPLWAVISPICWKAQGLKDLHIQGRGLDSGTGSHLGIHSGIEVNFVVELHTIHIFAAAKTQAQSGSEWGVGHDSDALQGDQFFMLACMARGLGWSLST